MDARFESRQRTRWSSLIGWNLVVAVAYAGVGLLSTQLVRETGLSSPVWPAAGIAVAAVLLGGARLVPGIVVGSFASNLPTLLGAVDQGSARILLASGIVLGAALAGGIGALIGAGLARRALGSRPPLTSGRDILRFLLLAGLLSAAVSATIGTAVQRAGGVVPPDEVVLVWLTWWVGDGLGIIVFAPLILMLAPGSDPIWRGRRWKVAVPSLLALTAVTGVILVNASLVLDQRAYERQQAARDAAQTLGAELERHMTLLESVIGFRNGSQFVRAEEFADFTNAYLGRHPDLQALSWNPVVPASEVAAFLDLQRDQPGFADYAITERAADGGLAPASPRGSYVPVGYIEPREANRSALGFDIASEPVRAEALDRARASGMPQITAPISLVQASGREPGALLVYPSVDANGSIDGFAVAAFRFGDLLDQTYGRDVWRDWNIDLTDVTGTPALLASRPIDTAAPTVVAADRLTIGGRVWEVRLWPTAPAAAAEEPATSPAFLLGGLAIVFLLEAFLLLLTGMEHRARREAESSSYEALHDELTGLLNRRGFFQGFSTVRQRVCDDGSSAVLISLDLDGFKAVNDRAGHAAGDEILRAVGTAIRSSVRDRDLVARLGGDEFAVIAINCDDEQGLAIAASVQEAIRHCTSDRADGLHVGASLGLAVVRGPQVPSVDALMRDADAACYEAKHAGRGSIRLAPA